MLRSCAIPHGSSCVPEPEHLSAENLAQATKPFNNSRPLTSTDRKLDAATGTRRVAFPAHPGLAVLLMLELECSSDPREDVSIADARNQEYSSLANHILLVHIFYQYVGSE